jgi:tetratricopeptide (TPR) repeat protein
MAKKIQCFEQNPFAAYRHLAAIVLIIISLSNSSHSFPHLSPCSSGFRDSVAQLMEKDKLREADGMFAAREPACAIETYDLMKWMRIKSVLGMYGAACRLACRIAHQQPQLSALLQNQLSETIREAPADTMRAALDAYLQCALSGFRPDTAAFKQWISNVYFRAGLYDEEVTVLLRLETPNQPSADGLFACASRRFSNRLFTAALRPALLAYSRLHDDNLRSLCAMMLYRCFALMGNDDSAAIWLGRVPARREVKAEAAAFFQRTGDLAKADSLLAALPPSLTKDTLMVRQMLFTGNPKAAADYCARRAGQTGAEGRRDLLFWRMRSLLFGGRPQAADALADSIDFSPDMDGATAFLFLKYMLNSIRKTPAAGAVFGELAYGAWLKRPERALRALQSPAIDACPADVGQLLFSMGVKALIDGKMFAGARTLIDRAGGSSAGPELRYYLGDVLLNQGDIDTAAAVFEELLLTYPGDVFSEKARILLNEMHAEKSGRKRRL